MELTDLLPARQQLRATQKQLTLLAQLGVTMTPPEAEQMTIEQASEQIKHLLDKEKEAVERAVEEIKRTINLQELAARYTTLTKNSSRDLHGKCPKCDAEHDLHVTDKNMFVCYSCRDQWGDVIAFVQWVQGVDFKTAVTILSGNEFTPTVAPSVTPVHKVSPTKPEDWRKRSEKIVETAHNRLLDDADQEAQAGRSYLENDRKLDPFTWLTFKLGYRPNVAIPGTEGKERAPAIVIPWYRAGALVAIRYRFLEAHGEHKKSSQKDSSFAGVLYGGQALQGNVPELSTLLLVEGEFNAQSIWQVARYTRLDVFSLGSESAIITDGMSNYARRYRRVLVWLDEEKYAKSVAHSLPGAYPIKSPNAQDANDLLQAGLLGGFLAMHRFMAAKDEDEQRRLLYDLLDAANTLQGVDRSTAKMIVDIGKQLGRTLNYETE